MKISLRVLRNKTFQNRCFIVTKLYRFECSIYQIGSKHFFFFFQKKDEISRAKNSSEMKFDPFEETDRN